MSMCDFETLIIHITTTPKGCFDIFSHDHTTEPLVLLKGI